MARNNEFIEYLLELLQATGDVKARPMFGGFGLYFYDASNHCSIMFALVADEALYFKTDKINDIDFEQRGLKAFIAMNATANRSPCLTVIRQLKLWTTLTRWPYGLARQ